MGFSRECIQSPKVGIVCRLQQTPKARPGKRSEGRLARGGMQFLLETKERDLMPLISFAVKTAPVQLQIRVHNNSTPILPQVYGTTALLFGERSQERYLGAICHAMPCHAEKKADCSGVGMGCGRARKRLRNCTNVSLLSLSLLPLSKMTKLCTHPSNPDRRPTATKATAGQPRRQQQLIVQLCSP